MKCLQLLCLVISLILQGTETRELERPPRTHQPPSSNGCLPIVTDDVAKSARGVICVVVHNESQSPSLNVDVQLITSGWEVEDLFVWVGRNASDVPHTMGNGVTKIAPTRFPFAQHEIRQPQVSLQVSLKEEMKLACSGKAGLPHWMSFAVSARSLDNHNELGLNLERKSENDGPNQLIPIQLVCEERTSIE